MRSDKGFREEDSNVVGRNSAAEEKVEKKKRRKERKGLEYVME